MANTAAFEDSDVDERRTPYDSDDESLIDVDSPADGYFAQRDHPQATFVQNPSRESEEKTREAAQERQVSRSVPATVGVQNATASRQSVNYDESVPLLDAGPAPPDYYQATAGRQDLPQSYSQDYMRDTSYGSISSPRHSQMQEESQRNVDDRPVRDPAPFSSDHPLVRNGLIDEQGVLSSRNQEPQSMRDPVRTSALPPPPETAQNSAPRGNHDTGQPSQVQRDEEYGSEPLPSYHHGHHHSHHPHHHQDFKKQRKGWRRCFYCCCIPRLGCLNILLIFGLIAMFIFLTSAPHSDGNSDAPSWDPIGSPPDDTVPIPDHENTKQCSYASGSTYKSFDFSDPTSFEFLEMIEAPSSTKINGKIRISPFNSSSVDGMDEDKVAIRVWVHVAATEPLVIKDLVFAKDGDGFELGFPDLGRRKSDADIGTTYSGRACLDFAVLIQVRSDVKLQDWHLTTANLDIEVEDGIFLRDDPPEELINEADKAETAFQKEQQDGLLIFGMSELYAIRGQIAVAYWSSRRTHVSTHSGSIEGTYALRDFLQVDSKSGSIDIEVEPKKAASEDPSDEPADFIAKSKSGSVNVEFPARHDEIGIPERQYRSRIETHSSSVSGRYLLGVSTSIKTHSGSIGVDVLPVSASLWNSTLHTYSHSGTTSLSLLGALTEVPSHWWNMDSIHSKHESSSGSINLEYPSRWEGFIEGRTKSGSINVRGEDVEIITDVHGPDGHRLVARKGIGGSTLSFKSSSGTVHILVGEDF